MDYEEVLRLINLARQACGKDVLAAIRNGAPSEPRTCPVAASLDGGEVAVEYRYAAFRSQEGAEKVRTAWGVTEANPSLYNGGPEGSFVFGLRESDVVPWSHTAVLPPLLAEFVMLYDQGVVPFDVAHDPAREEQ